MSANTGHPCSKPVKLMEWLISGTKQRLNIILDPFMGSGTTGVACVNQGRGFIGVELDSAYFDISVKRISDAIIERQGGPMFAIHQPAQAEMFTGG